MTSQPRVGSCSSPACLRARRAASSSSSWTTKNSINYCGVEDWNGGAEIGSIRLAGYHRKLDTFQCVFLFLFEIDVAFCILLPMGIYIPLART